MLGEADRLRWLHKRGIDLNIPDNRKETPMHHACAGGHFEAVQTLRCCPCIFKICGEKQYATWKEHDENDEFLAYQAIRRGFIKAYNLKGNGNAAHSLKGDFDFAHYERTERQRSK